MLVFGPKPAHSDDKLAEDKDSAKGAKGQEGRKQGGKQGSPSLKSRGPYLQVGKMPTTTKNFLG